MALKDKLPVSFLLFTRRGRMKRRTYWEASVLIWSTFYILYILVDLSLGYTATIALYPILFWALICTGAKRLHDTGRSGYGLWWVLLPVLGPLGLFWWLGFKRGQPTPNRFGPVPGTVQDYFTTGDARPIPHLNTGERIVDDVTQLNPVLVARVEVPDTVEQLQTLIAASDQVSIGGGRFSMGGQTASPGTVHVDMRRLNRMLAFSAERRTIYVEAGIRWCDIQAHIDAYGLSVKIMQTYANFTVGGSLSVNCHGRYMGLGPVILSVRSIDVVMADGSLRHASPAEDAELFYACVGCYNAVGVIARVELDLEANTLVRRSHVLMDRPAYRDYFQKNIRDDAETVFHNGDIYPPDYRRVRAVSWARTTRKPTTPTARMPLAASYPLERYFIQAFSRSRFGKWRRQHLVDPLLYLRRPVHWRNYEAGYDVAELEPASRKDHTYVLQEYFVPVAAFDAFADRMAEIFTRHDVNVINVSIRHALPDPGSLLAWARQEVFAFVVWYRQGTAAWDKGKVAVWTRELIDAALAYDGGYYLPYQPHATPAQFHAAYPRAAELFILKDRLDPPYKFRNVLWDNYYRPHANASARTAV